MSKPSVDDYQRLGEAKEVVITSEQLPLHCPQDNAAAWCAHPRVFLPIEDSDNQAYRCPYCGTAYRLVNS